MLSAPAAAELLQRADSAARLCRIAAELGFTATPERLLPDLHARLGIPPEIERARLIVGTGALRALVLDLSSGATVRETLVRTARALSATAPHCLWLVIGRTNDGAAAFIAAWSAGVRGPNVRTLLVDRHHVYAADAETLCALAAQSDGPDILTHTRWVEVLGRDALTRRFHADLVRVVRRLGDDIAGRAAVAARGELALLNVSRLLFLAFLQARGWLDGDYAFLQNAYEAGVGSGGAVHQRILEPLFFGTLNTRLANRQPRALAFGRVPYLNGGLFARTYLERTCRQVRFSDGALGCVFGDLLERYRFTPAEDHGDWSDTAIDPVILGRAFESLMDRSARRDSGTFYTPAVVVEQATHAVLERALGDDYGAASRDLSNVRDERSLLAAVRRIRILDPACGSGAFLVHVLRVLADLRVRLGGEARAAARASTLATSIYGVDISATAVWLCQLRLWLCLAVEYESSEGHDVPPLPNLDRNIRVGDSLAGQAFAGGVARRNPSPELAAARLRYVRAHGARKRPLARTLDALERKAAIQAADERIVVLQQRRRELLSAVRSPDLFGKRATGAASSVEVRRLRQEVRDRRVERERLARGAALPFSFDVQFADIAGAGGFDAIVGNPPWVRIHRLASPARASLKSRFAVCRVPSASARARLPFGAQIDVAAPFVERSLALLRPGGAIALLLPAKLWVSMAGAGLRQHLLGSAEVIAIHDYSEAGRMFDAATYPSLLVAARRLEENAAARPEVCVTLHRRENAITWTTRSLELALRSNGCSPWLLVPPPVRRAFDSLTRLGVPFSETGFGAPRLGVKTGCNAAFIVSTGQLNSALAEIRGGDAHGWVERELLRPVLRGELVRAWRAPTAGDEHIIWTHDALDRPLSRLPAHARRWLRQWSHVLAGRADSRGAPPWWRLFRTAAAANDRYRVVWCDIGRSPRALVLEPGDPAVPINTCYVAFADEQEAWALAALLNSPLAGAWLNVLAEPARGSYRRYLAWTMAMLPLPADQPRFLDVLAPLGRAAASGVPVSPLELLDGAIAAYGARRRDVAALLEWRDA